jgi:hypothetical protein
LNYTDKLLVPWYIYSRSFLKIACVFKKIVVPDSTFWQYLIQGWFFYFFSSCHRSLINQFGLLEIRSGFFSDWCFFNEQQINRGFDSLNLRQLVFLLVIKYSFRNFWYFRLWKDFQVDIIYIHASLFFKLKACWNKKNN